MIVVDSGSGMNASKVSSCHSSPNTQSDLAMRSVGSFISVRDKKDISHDHEKNNSKLLRLQIHMQILFPYLVLTSGKPPI
jgi:hypothetical protein